ncbi:alpha/beta fold hydrolase [Catenuloplanes japonicus]|uniref:alpha/beta fold hydrolase n=1 Tax=Catenuloplanes japonicus TaxID=33876 RepID=UPI0005262BBA|nr:alpha/beta hydrolase [Catenuloplanes japonicus]
MTEIYETGAGRAVLLLHGGAGPMSVSAFGDLLAAELPAHVRVPTHPGWNGTPRPDHLDSVRDLARHYADLLDGSDEDDVTVIGNSIGGWIAAEIALCGSPRVGRVVIINGVGLEVPGHPVADFFSLTPPELAALSYHDPEAFQIVPTEAQRAAMPGNREAIAHYAGRTMQDPTLAGRLAAVTVPVMVLWGQSDRIVDPAYGQAYADAIPGATYRPLHGTGHLPQVETPKLALDAVAEFIAG